MTKIDRGGQVFELAKKTLNKPLVLAATLIFASFNILFWSFIISFSSSLAAFVDTEFAARFFSYSFGKVIVFGALGQVTVVILYFLLSRLPARCLKRSKNRSLFRSMKDSFSEIRNFAALGGASIVFFDNITLFIAGITTLVTLSFFTVRLNYYARIRKQSQNALNDLNKEIEAAQSKIPLLKDKIGFEKEKIENPQSVETEVETLENQVTSIDHRIRSTVANQKRVLNHYRRRIRILNRSKSMRPVFLYSAAAFSLALLGFEYASKVKNTPPNFRTEILTEDAVLVGMSSGYFVVYLPGARSTKGISRDLANQVEFLD